MHFAEPFTRVSGLAARLLARSVAPARLFGVTNGRFPSRLLARNLPRGFEAARFFSFAQRIAPARFFGVSDGRFAACLLAGNLPRRFEATCLFGFAGSLASRVLDVADGRLSGGKGGRRIPARFLRQCIVGTRLFAESLARIVTIALSVRTIFAVAPVLVAGSRRRRSLVTMLVAIWTALVAGFSLAFYSIIAPLPEPGRRLAWRVIVGQIRFSIRLDDGVQPFPD